MVQFINMAVQAGKGWAYDVGVRAYRQGGAARQLYDAASSAIGQVALAVNPGYRYGGIRQEIRSLEEFKGHHTLEVLPHELQIDRIRAGINEKQKVDRAWQLITDGEEVVGDMGAVTIGRMPIVPTGPVSIGIVGGIIVSVASFLVARSFDPFFPDAVVPTILSVFSAGVALRSINYIVRSVRHQNWGLTYFLRDDMHRQMLKDKYRATSSPYTKGTLLIALQRVDFAFAQELVGSTKS